MTFSFSCRVGKGLHGNFSHICAFGNSESAHIFFHIERLTSLRYILPLFGIFHIGMSRQCLHGYKEGICQHGNGRGTDGCSMFLFFSRKCLRKSEEGDPDHTMGLVVFRSSSSIWVWVRYTQSYIEGISSWIYADFACSAVDWRFWSTPWCNVGALRWSSIGNSRWRPFFWCLLNRWCSRCCVDCFAFPRSEEGLVISPSCSFRPSCSPWGVHTLVHKHEALSFIVVWIHTWSCSTPAWRFLCSERNLGLADDVRLSMSLWVGDFIGCCMGDDRWKWCGYRPAAVGGVVGAIGGEGSFCREAVSRHT